MTPLTPDMFPAYFKAKMISAYPIVSDLTADEAYYADAAERDEAFARILASKNLRRTCEWFLEGHSAEPDNVHCVLPEDHAGDCATEADTAITRKSTRSSMETGVPQPNSDQLADALTRAAIYNDQGELAIPLVPYPMAFRCDERGYHRFEAVMRSHCADCGAQNSRWWF